MYCIRFYIIEPKCKHCPFTRAPLTKSIKGFMRLTPDWGLLLELLYPGSVFGSPLEEVPVLAGWPVGPLVGARFEPHSGAARL